MKSYYDENALDFINDTFNCDMSSLYSFFEPYLVNAKSILDIGFGSGRDILYFRNKGFLVYGIDPSIEMCNNAKKLGLDNIYNTSVLDMKFDCEFDAIWASASLLHIKACDLKEAFLNCKNALKSNGVMYCSFKFGEYEGERDGRFFTDMTKERLILILDGTGLSIISDMITLDVRENRSTKWLNVILK